MVQTYAPEQGIFQALKHYQRDQFFDFELEARERGFLPPFVRLAAIIISGMVEETVKKCTQDLRHRFDKLGAKQPHLRGPAPAPLFRVRRRYRYRFLMKCPRQLSIQKAVKGWIEDYVAPPGVRIQIDIDPQSFL